MKMRKAQIILGLLFLLVLNFQACTNKVFDSENSDDQKMEGNGDPYTGKPDPYALTLAQNACADLGANGKPLPNAQIFLFPSGAAQLVRENCVDITPRPLNPQDYFLNASGELVYQNQLFASQQDLKATDVVATTCLGNQTALANPVRESFLGPALDLSVWPHDGVGISLEGSLASLPVFRVERNDPTKLQDWRRIARTADMNSAETYVFSFFAKTDAIEKAHFFSFYPNNHDFQVEFSLLTGAARLITSNGATLISTQAQIVGGGLFISVYYQLTSSSPSNIGIGPSSTALGSSISLTAIQLEQLSNFCSR